LILIVADTLEDRLARVNKGPALRKPKKTPEPQVRKKTWTEKQAKKNQQEKEKRDSERFHLERIAGLFRLPDPRRGWTRVEALCFGKTISLICTFNRTLTGHVPAAVLLLCGPGVFSPEYVSVYYG
jgi:hypothetical protein